MNFQENNLKIFKIDQIKVTWELKSLYLSETRETGM